MSERRLINEDAPLSDLAEAPLGDRTQAQHRNVLIVASLAILIARLNLVPTKISAVGVDLKTDDRHVIQIAVLVSLLYFLAAFSLSAVADYIVWLQRMRAAAQMRDQVREALAIEERKGRDDWPQELARDPNDQTTARPGYERHLNNVEVFRRRLLGYSRLMPISYARAFLDFGLPIALSTWAFVELLHRLA